MGKNHVGMTLNSTKLPILIDQLFSTHKKPFCSGVRIFGFVEDRFDSNVHFMYKSFSI